MGNFAKKHKKVGIDWGIDTKDFEYFKLEDLLEIDKSVESMLKTLIQKDFLLQNKFENVLKLIETTKYCSCRHIYKKEK